MDRPAERRFQAAERRRMPAAAAKRRAASGRRGGDALPKIAYASMHRGITTPQMTTRLLAALGDRAEAYSEPVLTHRFY